MSIILSPEHIGSIKEHGEEAFPEECGGLLLGVFDNGMRTIREVLRLDNVRAGSRLDRFELNPLDYARAEREAQRRGLGIWGYYHSYPNHPAMPSGFDLEHAPFTEWSYVIVSVQDGVADDVRSWTLREDRSRFDEEQIIPTI